MFRDSNMLHMLIISVVAGLTGVLLNRLAPQLPDPIIWTVMVLSIGALAKPLTRIPLWRRIGAALAGAVMTAALGLALWP